MSLTPHDILVIWKELVIYLEDDASLEYIDFISLHAYLKYVLHEYNIWLHNNKNVKYIDIL